MLRAPWNPGLVIKHYLSRSNELLKRPAAREPAATGQPADQFVFELLCQHLVPWVGVLEFRVCKASRETHR